MYQVVANLAIHVVEEKVWERVIVVEVSATAQQIALPIGFSFDRGR